jgi:hypothetical protein
MPPFAESHAFLAKVGRSECTSETNKPQEEREVIVVVVVAASFIIIRSLSCGCRGWRRLYIQGGGFFSVEQVATTTAAGRPCNTQHSIRVEKSRNNNAVVDICK